jgi:putative redox protein
MAKNFKDDFIAIQTNLRDNPGAATATFEASTRQIAGLLSDAAIRDFTIKIDEPATLGGTDRGPNPVELVLAALGACQEITYRLYADTLGIPVNSVSVKLVGRLDLRGFFAVDDGVRPGFKDIHTTVTIDSPASADDIERLKATVDRHCPVLDILRNVTPVKAEYALQRKLATDQKAAAA